VNATVQNSVELKFMTRAEWFMYNWS